MRPLVRETHVRVTQVDPNAGVRRTDLVPQPVAYQNGPHQTGGLIAGPPGRDGKDGLAGAPGGPGLPGVDGRSIELAYIDANGHLIIQLSDDTTSDVGAVGGSGSSGVDSGTAAVPVGGHRVVRASGGQLYPANSSDTTQAGTVLGVSLAAAAAGASLTYKIEGLVTEPSWNFGPGPVYLASDASLTQAVPSSGFVQQIGVVQSPTQVSIQIQPPILIG
jgi:hypothetical protein